MKYFVIIFSLVSLLNCGLKRSQGVQFLLPLESTISPSPVFLTGLTISSGTIDPAFSSLTKNYTASVSNSTSQITITPTVTPAEYPVLISGNSTISGNASVPIALNLGSNSIPIVLNKPDGSSETYSLVVTRENSASDSSLSGLAVSLGTLIPSFSSAVTTYTMTLANAVPSITATPTATSASTSITVNGTSVTSGSASGTITVNEGSTTITIATTAENGSSTTYTINVTKLPLGVYRIFVTNSKSKGALGNIAGADTLCNGDANKPADGGTYQAFLAGTGRSANPLNNWVLKASTQYVRANTGVTIFTTNASSVFSFGSLTNSFADGEEKVYRTGLRSNWETSSRTCTSWTVLNAADFGRVGTSTQVDSNSIRDNSKDDKCSVEYHLLCVEQ